MGGSEWEWVGVGGREWNGGCGELMGPDCNTY